MMDLALVIWEEECKDFPLVIWEEWIWEEWVVLMMISLEEWEDLDKWVIWVIWEAVCNLNL